MLFPKLVGKMTKPILSWKRILKTSLKKGKEVTEKVDMIFEHFKLIFYALETNFKCLKSFYNYFS